MRIDVSGLQPAAQALTQAAAVVYEKHLEPWLVSIVAHGSALKGGYVAGGSDLDLVLFLQPGLLEPGGALPLERAIALHRDLCRIDPWPFRYIQAYAYPRGRTPGPGFVPGAYLVIAGEPEIPLASVPALVADAHRVLGSLDPEAAAGRVSSKLLQHGEDRLYRELRLLATDVWPVLYHVLTLQPAAEPFAVWSLPKPDAIAQTDPRSDLGRTVRGFYTNLRRHYAAPPERPNTALTALPSGLAFLRAAADWYAATQP